MKKLLCLVAIMAIGCGGTALPEVEECDTGYVLNTEGKCVPEGTFVCPDDGDCPQGYRCSNGQCVEVTQTGCTDNDECEDAEACIFGECVKTKTCTNNLECVQANLLCVGGRCALPAYNDDPCLGKTCGENYMDECYECGEMTVCREKTLGAETVSICVDVCTEREIIVQAVYDKVCAEYKTDCYECVCWLDGQQGVDPPGCKPRKLACHEGQAETAARQLEDPDQFFESEEQILRRACED